jgi:hypothetical protein
MTTKSHLQKRINELTNLSTLRDEIDVLGINKALEQQGFQERLNTL